MTLAEYLVSFSYTTVNYDLTDYQRSHFLKLGDTRTSADSAGTGYYCGASCTAHTFKLTSPVEQEVHISAHLHDDRSYPLDCNPDGQWSGIKYRFGGTYTYQAGWFEGPYHFSPRTMPANTEWEITLELPWYNAEITKDFSLVVFGA